VRLQFSSTNHPTTKTISISDLQISSAPKQYITASLGNHENQPPCCFGCYGHLYSRHARHGKGKGWMVSHSLPHTGRDRTRRWILSTDSEHQRSAIRAFRRSAGGRCQSTSKANDGLKFNRVVSGQYQVIEGFCSLQLISRFVLAK
jgi:hypothetical protein